LLWPRLTWGNGDVVRGLACRTAPAGSQWCEIHPVNNRLRNGWASARFLVATSGPGSATQLPGDVPKPGAGYNATGRLACVLLHIALRCPFGVIRRGRGDAALVISRPASSDRKIEFEAGRPVSSNGSSSIFGVWKRDDVIVTIGNKERYVVPNAVLFGG
jgi:hypothetical protein